MIPNTEWKKSVASLIAAVGFALICILSYLFIDGMSGGFALAFIAFFLAVSSVAVSLLFIHRARVMDMILHDPNPLAHWTYPEEMVRASVEREYLDFQERNRIMFIVIGGMLAIVALIFILFVEDGGLETGLFLLAFMVLLFVVSRVMPGIERRRALHAPRDSLISRTGIVYEGAVYPFRSFLITIPGSHSGRPVNVVRRSSSSRSPSWSAGSSSGRLISRSRFLPVKRNVPNGLPASLMGNNAMCV